MRFDYASVPLQGPEDQIRLLSFLASKNGTESRSCSLEVFTLDAAPRYAALSYVWGSKDDPVKWTCNYDGVVEATQNLDAALSHLSDAALSTFNRMDYTYLWADAICINQEDLEERKSQVLLMRRIYGRAEHTFVWLGGASASNSTLVDLIRLLRTTREKFADIVDLRKWYESSETASLDGFPDREDARWAQFDIFLSLGWFTRAWIIQELAVSKQPIMLLGNAEFTWDQFMGGVITKFDLDIKANHTGRGYAQLAMLGNLRVHIQKQKPMTLLRLLLLTRDFESTDDRDKIYSLLGLADDVSSKRLEIKPDYTVTTEALHRQVLLSMIHYGPYLEVLQLSPPVFQQSTDAGPSWSTNLLSSPLDATPFIPFFGTTDLDEWGMNFAAAPAIEVGEVRHESRPERLLLRGLLLDTVDRVGDVLDDTTSPKTFMSVVHRLGTNLWVELNDVKLWGIRTQDLQGTANGDLRSAYCQTLTAEDPKRPLSALRNGFDTWCQQLAAYRFLSMIPLLGYYLCTIWLCSRIILGVHKRESPEHSKFMDKKDRAHNMRRLLVTTHGHIGMGPARMVKSDRIFLLKGCRTPMALRRTNDPNRWTLVGACYVHGFMLGEGYVEERLEDIELI